MIAYLVMAGIVWVALLICAMCCASAVVRYPTPEQEARNRENARAALLLFFAGWLLALLWPLLFGVFLIKGVRVLVKAAR